MLVDLDSGETEGGFPFSSSPDLSQVYFCPNNDFVLIGTDFYDLQGRIHLGQLDTGQDYLDVGLSADGKILVVLTQTGLEFWQVLE